MSLEDAVPPHAAPQLQGGGLGGAAANGFCRPAPGEAVLGIGTLARAGAEDVEREAMGTLPVGMPLAEEGEKLSLSGAAPAGFRRPLPGEAACGSPALLTAAAEDAAQLRSSAETLDTLVPSEQGTQRHPFASPSTLSWSLASSPSPLESTTSPRSSPGSAPTPSPGAPRGEEGAACRLRRALLAREPNLSGAFRRILDPQGAGKVSYAAFASACRNVGFEGGVRQAWEELNNGAGSTLTLVNLDPYAGRVLRHFREALVAKCGDVHSALDELRFRKHQRYSRAAFKEWLASARLGLGRGSASRIFKCLPVSQAARLAVAAEDIAWLAAVELPVSSQERVKPGSFIFGHASDGDFTSGDDSAFSDTGSFRGCHEQDGLDKGNGGTGGVGFKRAGGDEDTVDVFERLYTEARHRADRERKLAAEKAEPASRHADMRYIERLYAEAEVRRRQHKEAVEALEAEQAGPVKAQPMDPKQRAKIQARLQTPRRRPEPAVVELLEEAAPLTAKEKKPLGELQAYTDRLHAEFELRRAKLAEKRHDQDKELDAELAKSVGTKVFNPATSQRLYADAERRADKLRKVQEKQAKVEKSLVRCVKGTPNADRLARMYAAREELDQKMDALRRRKEEQDRTNLLQSSVHCGVHSRGTVFERLYPSPESADESAAHRALERTKRREDAQRRYDERVRFETECRAARLKLRQAKIGQRETPETRQQLEQEAAELDRLVRAKAEERRLIEDSSKLHDQRMQEQTEVYEQVMVAHRANQERLESGLREVVREATAAQEAEERLRSRQRHLEQHATRSQEQQDAAAEHRAERRQSLHDTALEFQRKADAREASLAQARQRVQEARSALTQSAALSAADVRREAGADRAKIAEELDAVGRELAGVKDAWLQALVAMGAANEGGPQQDLDVARRELEAAELHKERLEEKERQLQGQRRELDEKDTQATQLSQREAELERLESKVRALEAEQSATGQLPSEDAVADAAARVRKLEAEVEHLRKVLAEGEEFHERLRRCQEKARRLEEQNRLDAEESKREQEAMEAAREQAFARLRELEREEKRLSKAEGLDKSGEESRQKLYDKAKLREVTQQRCRQEEQVGQLRRQQIEAAARHDQQAHARKRRQQESLEELRGVEDELARRKASVAASQADLTDAQSALAAAQSEQRRLAQRRASVEAQRGLVERTQQAHLEHVRSSERRLEDMCAEGLVVESSLEQARSDFQQAEREHARLVVEIAQARSEAVASDCERIASEIERVAMEREDVLSKRLSLAAQLAGTATQHAGAEEDLQRASGKLLKRDVAKLDARQERLDECHRSLVERRQACEKEAARRRARHICVEEALCSAAERRADAKASCKAVELEQRRAQDEDERARWDEDVRKHGEQMLGLRDELEAARAAQAEAEELFRCATEEADMQRKHGELELQRLEEETEEQRDLLRRRLAELERATTEAKEAKEDMMRLSEDAEELREKVAEETALFEEHLRQRRGEEERLADEKAEKENLLALVLDEVRELQEEKVKMVHQEAADDAEVERLQQAHEQLLRSAAHAKTETERIATDIRAKEAEYTDRTRANCNLERHLQMEDAKSNRMLLEHAEAESLRRMRIAGQAAAEVRKQALRLKTAPVFAEAEVRSARVPSRAEAQYMWDMWEAFAQANFRTIEDAFENFDLNKTGQIALHEFTQVLLVMGFEGDTKALFRVLDRDHDGLICFEDVVIAKKHGPGPKPVSAGSASPPKYIEGAADGDEERRQFEEERQGYLRLMEEEAHRWADRVLQRQKLVEAKKAADDAWAEREALEAQRQLKASEAQAAAADAEERDAARRAAAARRGPLEVEKSRLSLALQGAEVRAAEVTHERRRLSLDTDLLRATESEEAARLERRRAIAARSKDALLESKGKASNAEAALRRRCMAVHSARAEEADAHELQDRERRYLAHEGARLQRVRDEAERTAEASRLEQERLEAELSRQGQLVREAQVLAETAPQRVVADGQGRERRLAQARAKLEAAELEQRKLQETMRFHDQQVSAVQAPQRDAKGKKSSVNARALEKQYVDVLSAKLSARDRQSLLEKQLVDARSREAMEKVVRQAEEQQHQAGIALAKSRSERRGSDLRRKQDALEEAQLQSDRGVAEQTAKAEALREEASKRRDWTRSLAARKRELKQEAAAQPKKPQPLRALTPRRGAKPPVRQLNGTR